MRLESVDAQKSQQYQIIAPLNEKHGVFLARDEASDRMCVKKILKTYNPDVYERLRSSNIKGLPEIYHMEENNDELTVIEEYISGETVDSILKKKGAIPVFLYDIVQKKKRACRLSKNCTVEYFVSLLRKIRWDP